MKTKIIGSYLRSFGIRRKLFLAILSGVILSIGIITIINSIRFSNDLLSTTEERVSQITQTTNKYTLEKINHQLDLLISIAISETLKNDLHSANEIYDQFSDIEREKRREEIDAIWGSTDSFAIELVHEIYSNSISNYLERFTFFHTDEAEVFVTDKYGQIYSMSNLTSDYWQGDEEWWQESFSGKIYISNPIFDESSKTWAIIIAVPVFEDDINSDVIGVVRGTVDITPLFESIFYPGVGDKSHGAFVDNDGNIYYQSNDQLIVDSVSSEISSFIYDNEEETISDITDIHGTSAIASKVELVVFDYSLGWIVIFIHKSIITEIIKTSIIGNIFIGFVLIIVMGTLGLMLSNSILNVLRTLKEEASRLAVGDYSYRFSDNLINSNDPDICSLVTSIDKMKTAIEIRENRIREREKEYRQLVETMSEGLVVANSAGIITFVNPRLCQLIGYGQNEIVGRAFINFFPIERKENVLRLWNNPEMNKGKVYESQLVTNTGNIIHVAISTEPQFDDLGNHIGLLAVITDISDRKAFEMNLQRKLREISGLREIDTAILDQANYHGVVDTVLKQFKEHLHADGAAIYVTSPKNKVVEFASAYFLDQTYQHKDIAIDYEQVQCAAEMSEGRQFAKADNEKIICEFLHHKDFNILYMMPIIINNTYHGLAEIAYFDEIELDDEWHNYFNALLTQTAVGISKIQLLEDLRTRNIELKEAYEGIIKGWAKALELRDEETKGHSDRVFELSIKMAKRNHYTGSKMEAFRRGALLHDIGKMGIPDSILLKPGKLTPEEWEIMKLHPDLAYVLLSEIPFLKEAVEIPYYHHERWDGSGYPSGLKGEDIPLSARIFAVIDVWDALTSDRPYRMAWDLEKTRNYMIENKGVLFDPEVVDQFLELLIEEGIL